EAALYAALDRALERTARLALEGARERCPVRTGRLRDSLKYEREGADAVVSANTDYAVFVELGTGRIAPKPFLQSALYEAAEGAAEIYREEIFKS
ncbi:MAG: HK97 gp10 family phage protein, partial [Bacteroides sp.]|nr:HK97 gp10 family phage protein [Bacteroides sp.]